MIIGVDLGNYSVKTSNFECFASKISDDCKLKRNKRELIIDGETVYIGEGEFTTDLNKSKKENIINLLYGALAIQNSGFYQVVLGLPVAQYRNNKEYLKELILDNKFKEIIYNKKAKRIVIDEVEIAPEGASCFYSIPLNIRNEIGTRNILIVDIGGRTTDITKLAGDANSREIDRYITVDTAMFNIYNSLIHAINEKFTTNYKLEDAEDIIKNGLYLYAKNQDLSFIKPIIKQHFDSILKEINLMTNADDGVIYLTGGGALTLQQPFKNRFGNLLISKNPIFDNALGFKETGERLWQR